MINKEEIERKKLEESKETDKKSQEDFILQMQEDNLLRYIDDLVLTATDVLRELKSYQHKIRDEFYTRDTSKGKIVQWAMNQVQQINWHFDDGADVIANYAVAKISKKFSEKKEDLK